MKRINDPYGFMSPRSNVPWVPNTGGPLPASLVVPMAGWKPPVMSTPLPPVGFTPPRMSTPTPPLVMTPTAAGRPQGQGRGRYRLK